MVDDLIKKYGPDAEHHAYLEEDRAMRKTDTYQRGVWKCVRKELQRRYYAGEWE
jgi:hypothetical protein